MSEIPPKQQLMQMITGGWVSQGIYVAAKLKIADHLSNGPLNADELAEQTQCHGGALYRLLRALASIGIFTEEETKRFALTPLGEYLRSDLPDSIRPSAIMLSEVFYLPWAEFLYSVKTGQTAFEKTYGKPLFDYLTKNPEHGVVFDAAMESWMKGEAHAIVEAYDWSQADQVVDVGGGNGSLMRVLLRKQSELTGIVFDLPEVVERHESGLRDVEGDGRCRFVGGNFFDVVPGGADIYMLRNIIHDWDDDKAVKILSVCRDACDSKGKVLILEYVIPEGNDPFSGKWLDLMMLVGPGGKERTAAEYRELLKEAGFGIKRIIPTATDMSIIESERR